MRDADRNARFNLQHRIMLLVLTILLAASGARAATFFVTKTTDSNDGVCDADCSLREAVAAAAAAAGDDTVDFVPALVGQTIVLTDEIAINSANGEIRISGFGQDRLTIDGGAGTNRVFFIASGTTVMIDDVTITGGNGGGAQFAGFGGAILTRNAGTTLDLNYCRVTGNTDTFGAGGIRVGTSTVANINNSTFDGNAGNSGAIEGFASTVTITNSTISGNAAGGGFGGAGIGTGGTLTIIDSTITDNTAPTGGGVGNFSTPGVINVGNTIIAGNTDSNLSDANFPDVVGAFTSQGYNLIGAGDGSTGFTNGVNHDQVGTAAARIDPLLGPLFPNGGSALTHSLLLFSPAVDKGNSFGFNTDQRGFTRPVDNVTIANAGDGSDIGAFELQRTTAAPVSITGRVATAEGIGIGGAALSLSSPSGEVRGAISSPFGYFRFDDVQSGEVYLLTIRSKRFAFADPVRTFFLSDALDGVDFVGSPGKRAAPCYLSGFSRKQC